MASSRPQSDCAEHTKDIISLKKDMESVLRHEKKFSDSIDLLEITIADLNLTVKIFNEKFKDLPDKVRKLEDKSIFMQVFEKLAWIAVGALIVSMVNQKFIAPKEEKTYGIEYKVR